jgi:aminopeptidase N
MIEADMPAIRLIMRNNLKSPLSVEEVSIISKKAVRNFEKLFGIKYPFEKLDLVMCPEFKYGGMENVGCICFGETYFSKSQRENMADETYLNIIIHHEM